MNDITKFNAPARDQYRRAHELKSQHPKTLAMMGQLQDDFNAMQEERDRLFEMCERQIVDLTTLGHRVEFLEAELRRSQRKADEYERGYLTQRAELSVLATAGSSFTNACLKALEQSKLDLLAIGIDPDERTRNAQIDSAVEDLGKRFGANNRAPDQETTGLGEPHV